jgi:hypothetical protein
MAGFTKCLIYALVSLPKEIRVYLINVYSASLHGLSQRSWSLLWAPTMASSTEEQVDSTPPRSTSLPQNRSLILLSSELKELIAMHSSHATHGGDLKLDTVTIIGATLDLQEKVVKQVRILFDPGIHKTDMTPALRL